MSLCTDAYTDAYYSEYNFVSDLIRLISANGAEGSIKDIDALLSDVEGMDKELSEGLEEIIEFLGNNMFPPFYKTRLDLGNCETLNLS